MHPETDFERDALLRVPKNCARLFPGKRLMVVADVATWNAAGRELYGALKEENLDVLRPFVYERPISSVTQADCERLAEVLAGVPGTIPVVVGASALFQLVKLSIKKLKRSTPGAGPESFYAILTGVSSDAVASDKCYLSPLVWLKSVAPAAICADPDVLARAPRSLASAGYGALYGQFIAGADFLLEEFIKPEQAKSLQAWRLVQDELYALTIHPKELADGEDKVLMDVTRGLTAVGISDAFLHPGQSIFDTSEHLFARIFATSRQNNPIADIPLPPQNPNLPADAPKPLFSPSAPAYGHFVALGTLCSLICYIKFFETEFTYADVERALAVYPTWEERRATICASLGENATILAQARRKHLEREQLRERLRFIAEHWTELRTRLDKQLMYFPRMRAMLLCAGCPVTPTDLGMTPERTAAAGILAQMLSEQYTILDIAYETGRFSDCLQAIITAFQRDAGGEI